MLTLKNLFTHLRNILVMLMRRVMNLLLTKLLMVWPTWVVLEAIERKSTKSCEKVGKSAKGFRVREPYSFAPRDVKFLEDSCFLADSRWSSEV
ncbi:hypothetical protein OSB04_016938 [Centaurea solstitialis]|uniref:Uncharacterized protein n=1 Tax=Centaurea solstitialis TaxID=347529 RepID=A0AA38TM01_9ASTR|nr:hypothetical protein OSB04_016938 [Centaurea solstitialis]